MTPFQYILLAFSFFFGSAIGSFLNVCIVRIPKGESIVFPASHCPRCGTAIKAYDNIPLLGYLRLKGRCRSCGKKISWRYPLVEMMMALLSVLLLIRFGPTHTYLIYLAFAAALLVITFIDLDHLIIPDVISLPGIIAGFAASFAPYGIDWVSSGLGILAGGGSLMLVAVTYEFLSGQEGMGGGDIKLLAMMGAFIGWEGVLFTIMASSLLGTVIGGGLMVASGKGGKFAIPFGPFLSAGGMTYLFWGDMLIGWYLGLFA